MAKKTLTSDKKGTDPEDKLPWELGKQYKILLGFISILFSVALLLAFISFFIYGQEDQSAVAELTNRSQNVNNWLGKFGAFLADLSWACAAANPKIAGSTNSPSVLNCIFI